MEIWFTREKSLQWLNNELKPESKVLQEGFDYLESCVELFESIGNREGESEIGQFCRICGITLAKFSHLALGCYSLSLDALSQESGALLRPLIETYELLVYFRQDINRIDEAIEGELPTAGVIGKRISGDFKDLREHLNLNASHFSYRMDSLKHLFDKNAKLLASPIHSIDVFRTNLQMINAFQVFMLFEVVHCLHITGYDVHSLENDIENWRDISIEIFPPK